MLPRLVVYALVAAASVLAAPGQGGNSNKLDYAHADLWSLPLTSLHSRDALPETEAQLKARAAPDSITVSCFQSTGCEGTPTSTHTYTNTRKYNTQALLVDGPSKGFGSCRFDTTGNYRAYVQIQGVSKKKNSRGILAAPVSAIGTTGASGSYCLNQDTLSKDASRRNGRVVVIGRLGP